MSISEAEINSALSYGAMAARFLSVICPAAAPWAAALTAGASVAPDVEVVAQKIEAAIKGNGGVVTPEHVALVQAATAQYVGAFGDTAGV